MSWHVTRHTRGKKMEEVIGSQRRRNTHELAFRGLISVLHLEGKGN